MKNSFRIKNGINIEPKNNASTEAGDIRVDSSDSNKLKFHNGTSEAQIPRVDQLDAMEYDNSTSALTATNPQDAIDEVQANVDAAEADIATLQSDLDTAESEIDTLQSEMLTAQSEIDTLQSDLDTAEAAISNIPNDFANTTNLDLATSNTASTIDIGTGTGANTINIGGANSTVNITGEVNAQNVTNLEVEDKLVTLNKGGAAGSGTVTGIEVEEDSVATGKIVTSSDRNAWEFKAPNTAGVASLLPGGSDDEVALIAKAQTLSNKTLSAPVIDAISLTEQGSTPSTPSSGTKKLYAKNDGTVYTLNSSGEEVPVGSGAGGGGGINFIENPDAEVNAEGWAAFNDSVIVDENGVSTTIFNDPGDTYIEDDIAHGFRNGQAVYYTTTGTEIGGLTSGTLYYAITEGTLQGGTVNIGVTEFQVASSYANAIAGTSIDLTSNGNGDHVFTPVLPANATGGTANVTWTRTTSSPLRGEASFLYTKDAANRRGEGASCDFTIDNQDKGKVLVASFDYEISSGTYATGDLAVYILDVTNSRLIVPSTYQLSYYSSATRFVASFQASTDSTSYRLILFNASASTSAFTVKVDNVKVTPEQTVPGAIAWGPITETWTDDWANATTSVTLYRVGPKVFALGKTSMSGAGSTNLNITIPAAYTPSSIYVLGANNLINVSLGVNLFDTSAPTNIPGTITLFGANNLRIFSTNTGAYGGLTSTAPFTWASGDYIEWNASWEVSGWQASAALSTTETMSMGAFAAYSGDAASASTNNPVIVPTKRWDVLNSYNATTGLFTAPRTKKYKIYGAGASANSAGIALRAYVDSTAQAILGYTDSNGEFTFAGAVDANAGQTISLRPDNTFDAQAIYLYIEEWQDPTVFSVYGTTALYPATGYSSGGLVNYAITADQWGDLDSETLQPGKYDAVLSGVFYSNGAVTTTNIGIGLSTTSGNSSTGLVFGENTMLGNKNATTVRYDNLNITIPGIVVTTPTTYYFKSIASNSITNLQIAWSWRFRKVK